MTKSNRILIIDFCNFCDYPIGGYLSFAKNLMVAFGKELALTGITTDKNDPIGKWFKKTIDETDYDFFAFAYYPTTSTKHFIPDRVVSFFYLKKFKRQITSIDIKNIFIQRQEILLATQRFGFRNICYCFAGLENPLSVSKYWYSQFLARLFEIFFFKCLKKVDVILASGDEEAIQNMLLRSHGQIERKTIHQFPTRINSDVFKWANKTEARKKLQLPQLGYIVVTTGRLSSLKGWKLMIDSFMQFEKILTGSKFFLIGEGEDLAKIKEYITENHLDEKVFPVGKKDADIVALYLNAADIFIMGSLKEGWSTALMEAIACGVPSCVTNFSSAKSIISEGKNGYVIDKYDVDLFAHGMLKTVNIQLPIDNENINSFAVKRLKEDLLKIWHLK